MTISKQAPTFLSLLLFAMTAAGPGAVLAEWIDLGASGVVEVRLAWDALTLMRIPPGAFGIHPPGTLAALDLDSPTCNSPNCVSGQGFLARFDDRGCCGGGRLVHPVLFQVRYLEEAVRLLGADEQDLVLSAFDPERDAWVPLSEQEIDTADHVVRATESRDIRQFVAVFAGPARPGQRGTWGKIKTLFR